MLTRLALPLLVLAFSASGVASAPRWSAMGHRIVVRLAWDWMTPAARAAAQDLLEGLTLEQASVWADEIRPRRRSTAPLHYVNIPLGQTSYDREADCPADRCVVGAVDAFRAALADSTRPRADRVEALRFLLHLVGDLHQPLHVSDRDDRGGNQLTMRWRNRTTNLHSLWDGALLQAWGLSEGRYLQRLRAEVRRLGPAARDAIMAGTAGEWAMEGNAHAANVVYPGVPGPLDEPGYLRRAGPVLDQVLIRAGLRLARVLNQALDPGVAQPR